MPQEPPATSWLLPDPSQLPDGDTDGDLIGVVSTYERLRVCLPDYILWMDDLTPILDFEPFAEIAKEIGAFLMALSMSSWAKDIRSASAPIWNRARSSRRTASACSRCRCDAASSAGGHRTRAGSCRSTA